MDSYRSRLTGSDRAPTMRGAVLANNERSSRGGGASRSHSRARVLDASATVVRSGPTSRLGGAEMIRILRRLLTCVSLCGLALLSTGSTAPAQSGIVGWGAQVFDSRWNR